VPEYLVMKSLSLFESEMFWTFPIFFNTLRFGTKGLFLKMSANGLTDCSPKLLGIFVNVCIGSTENFSKKNIGMESLG
jgi:hypothetical protein